MIPPLIRRGSDNSDSSMASSSSSSSASSENSARSFDGHAGSADSRFVSTPLESVFDSDDDPRGSLLTYCTTAASFDELDDGSGDDGLDAADEHGRHGHSPFFPRAPLYRHHYPPRAVPSTPQEFASLFPPSPSGAKRLIIRHDESPLDGNMNVRVDCDAPAARPQGSGSGSGSGCDPAPAPAPAPAGPDRRVTLFHVRMYDQRDRDFSVRRYGRDCGREVAHVKRKVAKAPPPPAAATAMSIAVRPTLQRSVSRAFNTIRGAGNIKPVQRTDSGYKSASDPDDNDNDNDDDDDDDSHGQLHDHHHHQAHDNDAEGESRKARRRSTSSTSSFRRRSKSKPASNTCTLEFSNYAHVDLQRRGSRASKKYEFSYWGKNYAWRRTVTDGGSDGSEHVTFRLVNKATGNEVALIRPDPLTPEAAALDDAIGGVVPPCSMYIHDSPADPVNSNNCDVAE